MDPSQGIVAIKSNPRSGEILGTGFFVSTGLILTCAHVIEDYYHPEMTVYFLPFGVRDVLAAEVEFYSPKAEYDLAVLKPKRAAGFTALRVAASSESKLHKFTIFGYPRLGEIHGLNGAGTILGWIQSPAGHAQLQLDSRQVTHGFSGAPIWDVEFQSVVGIFQGGITDEEVGRPSLGLPMEVVHSIYPALPLEKPVRDAAQPGARAVSTEGAGVTINVEGGLSGNLVIGNKNITVSRNSGTINFDSKSQE